MNNVISAQIDFNPDFVPEMGVAGFSFIDLETHHSQFAINKGICDGMTFVDPYPEQSPAKRIANTLLTLKIAKTIIDVKLDKQQPNIFHVYML